MKNLIIRECEALPIDESGGSSFLTKSEAEELNRYVQNNSLDSMCVVWGCHHVKFINYVGFIQLSTCSIEILPKVSSLPDQDCRKVLINLLVKSGYFKIDYSPLSSLQSVYMNLLEIFGYLFAMNLKRELIKGIYSNYNYNEDNLGILRGKVLIKHQIRNVVNNSAQIYCGFEVFSASNPLNQIFKTVIKILIWYVRNIKTLEILKFCLLNFADIEETNITSEDIKKIQFDRTNQRFYPSFLLAKMFLQNYTSLTTTGSTKSFSILFKMNDLFEKYISVIAMKNLNYEIHVKHHQYNLLIKEQGDKGVFTLKPDIVFNEAGNSKLIIDMKWKLIQDSYSKHGVNRDDYFQMYAYLTRYQSVNTVILLYPHNLNIEKSGECLESWCLES